MDFKSKDPIEVITYIFFEFSCYISSALGVFFSKYLPQMQEGIENVQLAPPTLSEIIISFVGALIITFLVEDRNADRFMNMKKKLVTHFAYGIMFEKVITAVISILF